MVIQLPDLVSQRGYKIDCVKFVPNYTISSTVLGCVTLVFAVASDVSGCYI